ncbi:hypothetical protein C5167_003791 [Papaver somniferum]|uniref:Uncharacterized protein n=1 Tax=Papaver somniferum TaxID=3469 RepID=A0A4Y7L4K4_PAPSO|nr:hypothetical protein C5167_003791 [Papaver somniferum]
MRSKSAWSATIDIYLSTNNTNRAKYQFLETIKSEMCPKLKKLPLGVNIRIPKTLIRIAGESKSGKMMLQTQLLLLIM